MPIEIRALSNGDEAILEAVDPDVFDNLIDPRSTSLFLSNPLHHIVVAIDGGVVVGFVSAVHYFHPDKPGPELFINEVGVASSHQGQGIAKRLIAAIFESGRVAGCRQAWVLTERDNQAAMRLHKASGGEEAPTDSVMFSFSLEPPLVK